MSEAECNAFVGRFARLRSERYRPASGIGHVMRRTEICKAVAILAKEPSRDRLLFDFTAVTGKVQPQGEDNGSTDKANSTLSARALGVKSIPSIPLQRIHINPFTIPHYLANQRFNDVNSLLDKLNKVLRTDYARNRPGLCSCLQEYLDESCDFGQIYGHLRPWWFKGNFERVAALMLKRKEEDSVLRRNAIDGDCIVNPRVPPRRIWDLYSNRVLPFYVLPVDQAHIIPDNVWAVSHSWVAANERQKYRTRINGEAWFLPIPKETDPHLLRIELLNLGAEYVFLDVLCLRQKDDSKLEQEFRRKKEWRLDVPTIGYIYQADRTTVIYFNGLGKPFTMMPAAKDGLDSEFHWFRRVWTLQEASQNWLPGGLTASTVKVAQKENMERASSQFTSRLAELTQYTLAPDLFTTMDAVRLRKWSNPVDRVAGMAYVLQCTTLPIYDADLDVEGALEALVQSMSPAQRLSMLVGWGSPGEGLYTWRPSWAQLMKHVKLSELRLSEGPFGFLEYEGLGYLPNAGHQDGSDVYYHYGYVIEGCTIHSFDEKQPIAISPSRSKQSEPKGSDDEDETKMSLTVSGAESPSPQGTRAGTPTVSLPGTIAVSQVGSMKELVVSKFLAPLGCRKGHYTLVGVANGRYWVVGQKKGKRRVGSGKEGAIVLAKVTVLELDATSRRTILRENLGQADMMVVYH